MHADEGGGHKKFWGSFYAVACSFSHIESGEGAKRFHSFKGGREKFYLALRGGAKSFGPVIFPFCSPTSL